MQLSGGIVPVSLIYGIKAMTCLSSTAIMYLYDMNFEITNILLTKPKIFDYSVRHNECSRNKNKSK